MGIAHHPESNRAMGDLHINVAVIERRQPDFRIRADANQIGRIELHFSP